MTYQYCEYDEKRFATALRQDSVNGHLKWDSAAGQSVMVFRSPYGEDLLSQMEALCAAMTGKPLPEGYFQPVTPEIQVRYLTAVDKARSQGCPLQGEGYRYTVISCLADGECCRLFAPQQNVMNRPFCDVPVTIQASVEPVMAGGGLFGGLFRCLLGRGQEFSGFYHISFKMDHPDDYPNGGISVCCGEMTFPVTKEMVREGFCLPASEKPRLLFRDGLQIK